MHLCMAQAANQMLPVHLQGLSGDLAGRFPGGLSQAAFNPGQGLANPLAYSQAGIQQRRYSQVRCFPLIDLMVPGTAAGKLGMQDWHKVSKGFQLYKNILSAVE